MSVINFASREQTQKRFYEAMTGLQSVLRAVNCAYSLARRRLTDKSFASETLAAVKADANAMIAQAKLSLAEIKDVLEVTDFQLVLKRGYPWYFSHLAYAVELLGTERVNNGGFTTGDYWTLDYSPGLSIAGGLLVAAGAAATEAAIQNQANQAIPIVPGIAYELTYTLDITQGTVCVTAGQPTPIIRSASGTYVETYVAESAASIIIAAVDPVNDWIGSCDDVSIKAVESMSVIPTSLDGEIIDLSGVIQANDLIRLIESRVLSDEDNNKTYTVTEVTPVKMVVDGSFTSIPTDPDTNVQLVHISTNT